MDNSVKVGISCSKKGRKRIRTSKLNKKKSSTQSIQLARAAQKRKREEAVCGMGIGSPDSTGSTAARTAADSPTSIATDIADPMEDVLGPDGAKLTGASYDDFMERRLDFRYWGTKTYQGFQSSGAKNDLLDILAQYEREKDKAVAHKLIVCPDELPLNETSTAALAKMVIAVIYVLERIHLTGNIMTDGKNIATMLRIKRNGTRVRQWTLQFIHNCGMFCYVGYKKRTPEGLIRDPVAVEKMRTWMTNASKGTNAATANDFAEFVQAEFGTRIVERTARVWLRICGFTYKMGTAQQQYLDGHNRPDVLDALKAYTVEMKSLAKNCVTFTGADMAVGVPGAGLLQFPPAKRCVISYHDECSAHTNECNTRCWTMHGQGGHLPPKSRGPCRMVAAYCCADIGLWRDSLTYIEPGVGPGKDDYWKGTDTQDQAKRHIAEFEARFDRTTHTCIDVYDNSTGHDCKAADALNVASMNILPGGKNYHVMRDGTYRNAAGDAVQQSMYFREGDVLLVNVSKGAALSNSTQSWTAQIIHPPGEVVDQSSELLGVAKGVRQVALERALQFIPGSCKRAAHMKETNAGRKEAGENWQGDKNNFALLMALLAIPTAAEDAEVARELNCQCQCCVLAAQDDFANQVSGLEEVYLNHNRAHGTDHRCIFLPKFHPELNPIERAWSRMKWYVRKHNTGKILDLREAMETGLSEDVLPVAMIRRFCRLTAGYIVAYLSGNDILQAESWLSKRRSHRGYATTMDSQLENIYYPLGRVPQDTNGPQTPDIGQEELGTLLEALHPE